MTEDRQEPLPVKIHTVDFHADEWIAGTIELSLEEEGLYIHICALIYSRGGPIQVGVLKNRVHGNKLRALLSRLEAAGKIIRNGSEIDQKRARKELETAEKRVRKLRENGAKGGRPNGLAKPNGSYHQPPTTNHQEESPSPDTSVPLPRARGADAPLVAEQAPRPTDSISSLRSANLSLRSEEAVPQAAPVPQLADCCHDKPAVELRSLPQSHAPPPRQPTQAVKRPQPERGLTPEQLSRLEAMLAQSAAEARVLTQAHVRTDPAGDKPSLLERLMADQRLCDARAPPRPHCWPRSTSPSVPANLRCPDGDGAYPDGPHVPYAWIADAAAERYPDVDADLRYDWAEREAFAFERYWRNGKGANVRRTDWLRTWQHWISRARPLKANAFAAD